MLPAVIVAELFNPFYRINKVVIDHLVDTIEAFGYMVTDVDNRDAVIVITFNNSNITGTIRVERICRRFEIEAVRKGWRIMPSFGDWDTVSKYLLALLEPVNGQG